MIGPSMKPTKQSLLQLPSYHREKKPVTKFAHSLGQRGHVWLDQSHDPRCIPYSQSLVCANHSITQGKTPWFLRRVQLYDFSRFYCIYLLGTKGNGVAGSFLPLRHDPDRSCHPTSSRRAKPPQLIAWANVTWSHRATGPCSLHARHAQVTGSCQTN